MSVTVNPPANAGDPAPIQTDVTNGAKVDKYVGLVNAPVTFSSSAAAQYVGRKEYPHQPASWKVA